MTRLARLTEVASNMIRVSCRLKISGVALVATGEHQLIVTIKVTGLARNREMGSGESKFRCAVAECGWLPSRGCMARFTLMVEKTGDVIRAGRRLIVGLMARVAFLARIFENLVLVTGNA